jgi:integrase
LSREDIAAIIKAIVNLKHKTMIMLGYGCGLRVSEITALQVNDIDGKRRLLFVKKRERQKRQGNKLKPCIADNVAGVLQVI